MDGSTIFYIIAVIIYFIYTSFTKKNVDDSEPEMESGEHPPKQGPSFEDLLREIRRDQKQEIPEEKPKEWDEPIPEHEFSEPVEEKVFTEENKYPDKEREFSYTNRESKQPMVKLDDQVDIEDDQKILGDVVDVAGDYHSGNKYSRLLKNPETVKDAVVLSEIFNRKHF